MFWDHAAAQTRLPQVAPDGGGGDRLQRLERDGLGVSLRIETGPGTVGIDYGLEPGRPPLEGKIHLRLVSSF